MALFVSVGIICRLVASNALDASAARRRAPCVSAERAAVKRAVIVVWFAQKFTLERRVGRLLPSAFAKQNRKRHHFPAAPQSSLSLSRSGHLSTLLGHLESTTRSNTHAPTRPHESLDRVRLGIGGIGTSFATVSSITFGGAGMHRRGGGIFCVGRFERNAGLPSGVCMSF